MISLTKVPFISSRTFQRANTQLNVLTTQIIGSSCNQVRRLLYLPKIGPLTKQVLPGRAPFCPTLNKWIESRVDDHRWRKSVHLALPRLEKSAPVQISELSEAAYEKLAEETLGALTDYFEDLTEEAFTGADYDVVFSQRCRLPPVLKGHPNFGSTYSNIRKIRSRNWQKTFPSLSK
ncbi:frataxin, mitochondrial isoform X5 [Platichthys flesus]|uniref:frataxin, mitochondrial isoform X5 n=1 Tax=Platichthys flesus TaxID=8260 RepID=UPI002DBC2B3E|nr:frataxin, mitochondrial isoform X5 [Platichthys flesus]